jgi:predicted DNA-binding transcriptional regulator YafY
MSINKLALIRYRTIDECLRNRYRKWTLDDLIEKVSDILYDTEGIRSGVSRRTIQADIQLMRSDKLGYNAPIIVKEKKYYTYEDADYSITSIPITDTDLEKMKEIVGLLKQFNGFSYFDEMSDMIARLENNLYKSAHRNKSYIQLEGNKLLKGLEFITPIYQAILDKKTLQIEYKSFRAAQSQFFICFPYLLKEYRNRWFLITRTHTKPALFTLALDRMISLQDLPGEKYMSYNGVDFDRYYDDLIGVTKSERDRAHKVFLFIDKDNAPYVLTKPLHHSQQLIQEQEDGIIIRIDVVLNFELEREILGFGEYMQVLAPRHLAKKIRQRLEKANSKYEQETKTDKPYL